MWHCRSVFLLFPGVTQLDLTGPFEVFARIPNAQVHLIWKQQDPVISDRGLAMLPTTDMVSCPAVGCDLRTRWTGTNRVDGR